VSYLARTDLAHVKPGGMTFDELGRGEEEGKRNFTDLPETGGSSSMEVLRKVVSAGYTRGRLPQELVLLQGGAGETAFVPPADGGAAFQAVVERAETVTASAETPVDARTRARMQGYEGDPCGECGNYTLVRNGTCMKCNTCGATSGCS